MVHADADPARIGGEIVDPIGNCPAKLLDQEIMHADLLGLALRPPFPSVVLEVADQFLLLRVDADDRQARLEEASPGQLDVAELAVPVRVRRAGEPLLVGPQREAEPFQEPADGPSAAGHAPASAPAAAVP